jgi:predicted small lipoprotein YifL
MNSLYRLVLLCGFLFVTGCGQKGPLYLPENPSQIRTEVRPQAQSETEDEDANKEKEQQDENE